jgi:peptide/nickel transport system ATP-binding protein
MNMRVVQPFGRPAAERPTALEVDHLSKTFVVGRGLLGGGKPLRAVDDVSLSVRRGEVLGIVGESGSGKTTLTRMMLGLLKPTAGDISIDGESVKTIGRTALGRKVQPVFQDPYASLNPRKTIGQIIALPLQIHGATSRAQVNDAIAQIMAQVGLNPRLVHSYPSQLSGGQRQRVAIARALVARPEILICDEPTSALDVSVQAQILNLLKDLRAAFNLTYVFVTHDLGILDYVADRICVMYMGRIVELAPARDLLARPRHPYSQALLSSVLTPDPSLGLPDLSLGRGFPDPLHPPSGCPFHPRCAQAMPQCATVSPLPRGDARGFVECHLYPEAPPV